MPVTAPTHINAPIHELLLPVEQASTCARVREAFKRVFVVEKVAPFFKSGLCKIFNSKTFRLLSSSKVTKIDWLSPQLTVYTVFL